MKILKFAFIAILALTAFVSCKKDKDEKNNVSPTIEGRWEGQYVNDASGNSFYFSLRVKPGGVIEELTSDGQVIGQGTWEFDNNILTANYNWPDGSEFSIIASFYQEQVKLLGNWGYDDSNTNGGTFEMEKTAD